MADVANQMRKLRNVLLADPKLCKWARWCEAAADQIEGKAERCHYCDVVGWHLDDCHVVLNEIASRSPAG